MANPSSQVNRIRYKVALSQRRCCSKVPCRGLICAPLMREWSIAEQSFKTQLLDSLSTRHAQAKPDLSSVALERLSHVSAPHPAIAPFARGHIAAALAGRRRVHRLRANPSADCRGRRAPTRFGQPYRPLKSARPVPARRSYQPRASRCPSSS